jgi:hypothetical protein
VARIERQAVVADVAPVAPWRCRGPGTNPQITSLGGMISTRLCALVAGITLIAGLAFAQTNPTSAPTAPLPGKNLSEKLDRSNGVIHPKEVDPAIEKPPPPTRDANVLPPNAVPPPGTSSDAAPPQPK